MCNMSWQTCSHIITIEKHLQEDHVPDVHMSSPCSQLAKSVVQHASNLCWEVVVGSKLAIPDIVHKLHMR